MMGKRWSGRAVTGILAAMAAAGVVAAPAPAAREDLRIFVSFATVAPGTPIGVGGDGSLVFFTSFFSFIPPESTITAADLEAKPFLSVNADMFTWNPAEDTVDQFTATANIENEAGDDVATFTSNEEPSVVTRTYNTFVANEEKAVKKRVSAVAFRSNADQGIPGPSAGADSVDPRIAALGSSGATIFVWDSETDDFTNVFETLLNPQSINLESPSLALKSKRVVDKIRGHNDDVAVDAVIGEVLVAFSGNANVAADNFDGNSEVFLWKRSDFQEGVRNDGVQQVTHTVTGDCFSPAVNRKGEIAFLSTSDITGRNPDGSVELFLWRRGRFKQLTSITAGALGTPRWSGNGRTLVFDATADVVRSNPDESSEIFVWNRRKVRQITEATVGDSSSPSVDDRGRRIAFLSDANTSGVVAVPGIPEVVVTNRSGKKFLQVTETLDGGVNEVPVITSDGRDNEVTWVSSSNFDGRNSNNTRRIYRTKVGRR